MDSNERFYKVVWPHRATVLRAALLLTHRDSEAADITQEALIKAWQKVDHFDGNQGSVQAWLLTILRHCWVDRLRSAARHGDTVSLEGLPEDPPAVCREDELRPATLDAAAFEQMLERLSDQHLITAIKQLPSDFRWAILLVDVHGYSYEEAATALEVPVGTIRSRLFRARDFLRQRLAAVEA